MILGVGSNSLLPASTSGQTHNQYLLVDRPNAAFQRLENNCASGKLSMRGTLIPLRCKRFLGAVTGSGHVMAASWLIAATLTYKYHRHYRDCDADPDGDRSSLR
jgi:hypothetical protein